MSAPYDSIMTATDSNGINRSELYKIGVTEPDRDIAMVERGYAVSNDDYVVGGMLAALLLVMLLIHSGRHMMVSRFKEFFTSKRLYSDDSASDTYTGVLIVLALMVVGAASLAMIYFGYLEDRLCFNATLGIPYWVFAVVTVALLAFVALKAGLYSVVNWVFFNPDSNRRWMRSYALVTAFTSLVIFPIALVDVFFAESVKIVTWCVISSGIVYELLLFYKLFANFKSKSYGYLLIFLYFCSAELLPTLVLWNGLGWITDNFIVKNIVY